MSDDKISPSDEKIIQAEEFFEFDDFEGAIELCCEAIALNPDNAKACNGRGINYCMIGELDLAIADFDAVIKFESDNARACLRRLETVQACGQRLHRRHRFATRRSRRLSTSRHFLHSVEAIQAHDCRFRRRHKDCSATCRSLLQARRLLARTERRGTRSSRLRQSQTVVVT